MWSNTTIHNLLLNSTNGDLWKYVPMVMTYPVTWCFPDMTGLDFTSRLSAWQSTDCQPISTVAKSATEKKSNPQNSFYSWVFRLLQWCSWGFQSSWMWHCTIRFGHSVSKQHSVLILFKGWYLILLPKTWTNQISVNCCFSDIQYLFSVYKIKQPPKSSTSVFFRCSHNLPVLKCWLDVSADSCTT